ncbi:MAG: radical SAM protein [Candidatus Omnitrophica bacterium]|nr:radical SAM protein [Candidatus Omnitrophota bacterium]
MSLAGAITKLREYASDSAAILRGESCGVLNVSFNEQSCNLNCRVCGFSAKEVRSTYGTASAMDSETFEHLVAAVPNRSDFWFDISAIAETLQFDHLEEFIARLKSRKPQVNTIISTNGTLLTPERCQALVSSGLDFVQFSLFAPDPEGYAFITQTKVPFEKVVNNLLMLSEARGESKKPGLEVFIYDTLDFRDRAVPFIQKYRDKVDEIYFRKLYDTAGMTQHGLNPEQTPERYPCGMLWYSGAVRSTGDFLMCYPIQWKDRKHKIANVRTHSLKEYWRSLEPYRIMHLEGRWSEIPACKECDAWSMTPSVFSKRKDGSFHIPWQRRAAAKIVNGIKALFRTKPFVRMHRS